MVDEPVDCGQSTEFEDAVASNKEPNIFVIRHGRDQYLGFVRSIVNFSGNDVKFSIVGYNSLKDYFIEGLTGQYAGAKLVSKERFIDFVSANYPDHFEWLLFHPEWLS